MSCNNAVLSLTVDARDQESRALRGVPVLADELAVRPAEFLQGFVPFALAELRFAQVHVPFDRV